MVWEDVLEALLALLLLGIDCGNAAQRESVFCHRDCLRCMNLTPPSAESSVFMTKTCEKQQFACIFRCGPNAKSGVQEKLKFGRLKGVLGGPEAHI